jgi:hypothetical protein
MKHLRNFTIVLLFFVVVAVPAFAQTENTSTITPSPTTTEVATPTSVTSTTNTTQRSAMLTQAATRREAAVTKAAERKQATQETIIENLRNRATKEIDRRIEAMNRLITKITNLKKLSDTQKATLTSQVQTEITNLTSLKTKILADTDLTTLRTDVKSIVSSYRIYALFIPKINILTAAESTNNAADQMTSASAELAKRIQEAKNNTHDTSALETSLATVQAKIADAKSQAQIAIDTVIPLTPDGYPANKSSLDAARQNLKTAREDLMNAKTEAKSILSALRQFKKSDSVKPSESVSSNSSTTTSGSQ